MKLKASTSSSRCCSCWCCPLGFIGNTCCSSSCAEKLRSFFWVKGEAAEELAAGGLPKGDLAASPAAGVKGDAGLLAAAAEEDGGVLKGEAGLLFVASLVLKGFAAAGLVGAAPADLAKGEAAGIASATKGLLAAAGALSSAALLLAAGSAGGATAPLSSSFSAARTRTEAPRRRAAVERWRLCGCAVTEAAGRAAARGRRSCLPS